MSFTHPRRTTKTTASALTPTSSSASGCPTVNTNMSLRKGATFHSVTSPERDIPHHFKVPSLPRRSQTTLEDVVDAHKRRVAMTLGHIDRGLSAVEERSPTAGQSFPDEANPVPQGFLNHTVGTPADRSYGPAMTRVMNQEPAASRRSSRLCHNRRSFRDADSGLGSSIGSSHGKKAAGTQLTSISNGLCAGSIVTASAITRSAAAPSSTIERLPRLSVRASNRIHEHILKPLLAKSSLKDFHPIIKDCPRRIHGKEIVCLRDLEKTLVLMAPERTKTAALYLDFCLTSIRCIQATVEFLGDHEQTRPHDRPYTNGYFVDLVDQIKQYAQQIQAAKEREERGEEIGEMDPETTDEILLHGGLSKNGRPAELVRVKKNGKAISIATGLPVDIEEEDSKDSMRFKRSLSEEAAEDESILRSMARRKRSASAAELAPKRCREPGCEKEFKRPCDLTKHEKTHSRPWKCPVESCKYHKYGWPTGKEMDRHHNDKHSSAPPLYECHFKPCPYRSKRESNCKQHMEKAHNWTYVRSKNNGKNRDKASGSATKTNTGLPTPTITNMHTPSSSDGNNMATPEDDDMMTGYDGSAWDVSDHGAGSKLDFPIYPPDEEMFAPGTGLNVSFSPVSEGLNHNVSSNDQSPFMGTDSTQDQFAGNFDQFAHDSGAADFSLFENEVFENEDLYSANVHLPTPDHNIFNMAFETSGLTYGADSMAYIAPVGHGSSMLYTPTSLRDVDEGFEDFAPNTCNKTNNFELFSSSIGGITASSAPSALFGEIPSPLSNLAGASAQELLDFYAASTAAASDYHPSGMNWASHDQFSNGYRSYESRREC